MNIKRILKKSKLVRFVYYDIYKKKKRIKSYGDYLVPEVFRLIPDKSDINSRPRINLVIPSLYKNDIYGGISTAMTIFKKILNERNYDGRIVVTDRDLDKRLTFIPDGFEIVDVQKDINTKYQIVSVANRENKKIKVRKNDVFLCTIWWTAYIFEDIILWQNSFYNVNNKLMYLIQDFEPGFYQWSTRYMYSLKTYNLKIDTIAIFNSRELMKYFKIKGFKFYKELCFDPVFNEGLRKRLNNLNSDVKKEKIILIYGRPEVNRNAFEFIIESIKLWVDKYENAKEWKIYSIGVFHPSISINKDIKIKNLGKLTIEQYASLLIKSKIGISLMVSPHPSYPPLEMSVFGLDVITNEFECKNLSDYSNNIYSLKEFSTNDFVNLLIKLTKKEKDNIINKKNFFDNFDDINKTISYLVNEIDLMNN